MSDVYLVRDPKKFDPNEPMGYNLSKNTDHIFYALVNTKEAWIPEGVTIDEGDIIDYSVNVAYTYQPGMFVSRWDYFRPESPRIKLLHPVWEVDKDWEPFWKNNFSDDANIFSDAAARTFPSFFGASANFDFFKKLPDNTNIKLTDICVYLLHASNFKTYD